MIEIPGHMEWASLLNPEEAGHLENGRFRCGSILRRLIYCNTYRLLVVLEIGLSVGLWASNGITCSGGTGKILLNYHVSLSMNSFSAAAISSTSREPTALILALV